MGRPIDYSIIGEEFGCLKVLKLSSYRRKNSRETYWDCLCSLCNQTSPIERKNLLSGNTNSCGCRRGKANQVAELAQVSKSTVSAVMNGKWRGQLTEATANKVKAAAKKIGYIPYYARRSL
jgi:hypothetical protein